MDNNLFTDKQIEYLYADGGFLSFVNKYFSTFSTCIQEIGYDLDTVKISDADMEIYLRIVLANIETLHELISELDSCLSMSHVDKEVVFVGNIQGRLNVTQYTKYLWQGRYPKDYPCVTKAKTYVTSENIYVIFIVKNILEMLGGFKKFLKKKGNTTIYSELNLIEKHSKAFKMFSTKAYFKDCQYMAEQLRKSYGMSFPMEQLSIIKNRIHKGKIRNAVKYQKVFEWYDSFRQGSVVESNSRKINILRYSEDFSNKLFELWCLYSIKETFITEFEAVLVEEKNIMDIDDGYVYKLAVPTGGILEIYYQRGVNLYWRTEDELVWKYNKDGTLKGLRGIPDISIRYTAQKDSLIMVDIKNRVRKSGANTEEIYKMIGYFTNFRRAYEEYFSQGIKKQGALIFRNDINGFDELLESENGYRLLSLSVGVGEDSELNIRQFKKLCKYVLDVQGMDGTTSEIMGSYSKTLKFMEKTGESGSDDCVYELSERNHAVIQSLFSFGELAEQLPKYKERLKKDHFPHVWDRLSLKTQDILAMAECLYDGVNNCDAADYAPICLEYCRALEVEMNELIFTPFKNGADIVGMAQRNYFYDKLKESREMTLGECVFLLDKCTHPSHPLTDLKRSVQTTIKHNRTLLGEAVGILRSLNENVRRLSAHTTVMCYNDLINTRQMVLGIGNLNLFYTMRDDR